MRVWNIMLIMLINYIFIIVASAFIEIEAVTLKATHVKHVIETAADMSLEQTQAIDDFIATEEGNYQILAPNNDGSSFELVDLYEYLYGLNSTVKENKEKIFDILYNTEDFKSLAVRTGAVRKHIKFYQYSNGQPTGKMQFYSVPVISQIGTSLLPPSNVTKLKTLNGNYVADNISNSYFQTYDSVQTKKYNSVDDEEANVYYYHSPISLGVTYVNPTMLSRLFVANVDALMRSKYVTTSSGSDISDEEAAAEQGDGEDGGEPEEEVEEEEVESGNEESSEAKRNLNDESGGLGVARGNTMQRAIPKNALEQYNPINDGVFTFLRGSKNEDSPFESYEGVKPDIEYKIIDMYDSANDQILVDLFGADKGSYTSKATYLKSLDEKDLDPATNQPYKHKYFVVAKVTFNADILVPYFSPAIRELVSRAAGADGNYLSITAPMDSRGKGNSIRYKYTRYFAVTP